MRRIVLALLLALAPALASADVLTVTQNQAVRLTLPLPARDIIVGDPDIADVTVADRRHLIVVGKAFGSTNLIVTGENGQTLFNRQIMVPTPQIGRVTVINGSTVASYACAPLCVASDGAGGAGKAPDSSANSTSAAGASSAATTPETRP